MSRILIIEDEEQTRRMIAEVLQRAGYEVSEARDGVEGLRRYRESPTDLIITDILMPEKEGLETIMTLKRESPQVKIIAMSGGGRAGNLNFLEIARRLGAQLTLEKPFELQEMLAAVVALLPE